MPAPIPRPCLDCGTLTTSTTRCQPCQRTAWRDASRQRGPRPHYAGDYHRRAKAIRDTATTCYWCGNGFTLRNPPQADHLNPGDPDSPLVAACRTCNIARSNRSRTQRSTQQPRA